jgi:hypothetical protein
MNQSDQRKKLVQLSREVEGNLFAVAAKIATPLALSLLEERAYEVIFEAVGVSNNQDQKRTGKLAKLSNVLSVPDFNVDFATLFRLRQSEEFTRWRDALSRALEVIDDLPEDEDGIHEARAIVTDELESALADVLHEANGSAVLTSLSRGWKRILLTGVASLAPAALGDPITTAASALAGAGAAAAIGLDELDKSSAVRNSARTVREVLMSFRP